MERRQSFAQVLFFLILEGITLPQYMILLTGNSIKGNEKIRCFLFSKPSCRSLKWTGGGQKSMRPDNITLAAQSLMSTKTWRQIGKSIPSESYTKLDTKDTNTLPNKMHVGLNDCLTLILNPAPESPRSVYHLPAPDRSTPD